MAEYMLLDTRGVDDVAIEIQQSLAIGERKMAFPSGPGPK